MYEMLKGHGIVPVIKFDSADDALPLADAWRLVASKLW